MFEFYICSSSLKNTTFNFSSSRDKLTVSRIPFVSNEKCHTLVFSSLYFEEFPERRRRLLWINTRSFVLLGVMFLFKECMKE